MTTDGFKTTRFGESSLRLADNAKKLIERSKHGLASMPETIRRLQSARLYWFMLETVSLMGKDGQKSRLQVTSPAFGGDCVAIDGEHSGIIYRRFNPDTERETEFSLGLLDGNSNVMARLREFTDTGELFSERVHVLGGPRQQDLTRGEVWEELCYARQCVDFNRNNY